MSTNSKQAKPSVAIFASAYLPHQGGVEEVVRQITARYRARGLGVVIFTNRWPRDLPEHEDIEGIPVYRVPFRLPVGGPKAWLSWALTSRSILARVQELLTQHRCELVHVHCVSSNGHYALQAARKLGLKLVLTAHGERQMDADRIFERSTIMRRLLLRLLSAADAITTCSEDTLRDLEAFYGASLRERAQVIYGGVDSSFFNEAEPALFERPYVLALGRLVPQKGFYFLLEAYSKARLSNELDLVIAGGGSEETRLKKRIDELGLGSSVRLVGAVDRARAASLFKGALFFVLPSQREPMGLVNLEAMSCGKAVLANRVGGVPEIVVDQKTGWLVDPKDVDEWTAALRTLAHNESLRKRLGQEGAERARGFRWDSVADRYLALYQSLGFATS